MMLQPCLHSPFSGLVCSLRCFHAAISLLVHFGDCGGCGLLWHASIHIWEFFFVIFLDLGYKLNTYARFCTHFGVLFIAISGFRLQIEYLFLRYLLCIYHVFLKYSASIPSTFFRCSQVFLRYSSGIPQVLLWYSLGIPQLLLRYSLGIPYNFLRHALGISQLSLKYSLGFS